MCLIDCNISGVIQRLRSKIGAAYIETVYKYGYRFNADAEVDA